MGSNATNLEQMQHREEARLIGETVVKSAKVFGDQTGESSK
jgi:hypothetical protein